MIIFRHCYGIWLGVLSWASSKVLMQYFIIITAKFIHYANSRWRPLWKNKVHVITKRNHVSPNFAKIVRNASINTPIHILFSSKILEVINLGNFFPPLKFGFKRFMIIFWNCNGIWHCFEQWCPKVQMHLVNFWLFSAKSPI